MIHFLRPTPVHRYNDTSSLDLALTRWRWRLVGWMLAIGFFALLLRAFYLQVIHDDFLQEKGDSRYLRDLEITALRGRITDRNGELLAVSTPMRSVWAIPADARAMTRAQKEQLASLLSMTVRDIDNRLASEKNFSYIRRLVAPEVADRVAALRLPGIHFESAYRRYYPSGEICAHLVGFTGVDDKGLEGVELTFDHVLPGRAGLRTVIRDRRGNVVEDVRAMRPPLDGKDITLSMNAKIQYIAYRQLRAAVHMHKAKAGSVIVLDPRSGEILAMVNLPTYNPNDRSHLTGNHLRNRAVTDTFEPGSTMKPFTAALALEKGTFRYDSPINTAPGRLSIGSATISDSHPHGVLSVAQVIQKSSNIGTSKIGLTFAPREMWEMFDMLGFGRVPQLGFPGEAKGRLRPWKNWRPIEQATMSYGHGIAVSLVQLARAYTVFARDGDLIPLSLVKSDEVVLRGQRVFSDQTVREMRAMLELAAGPGGTAPQAQVPGYRIGGKTGTAHKLEAGVYARKYVASFVGLAPIDNPRLVVAVMIDEPSAGKYFGGSVAGPVFSQVMGESLRILGVQPQSELMAGNNKELRS